MLNVYEEYWCRQNARSKLRTAIVLSLLLHAAVVGLFFGLTCRHKVRVDEVYAVQIMPMGGAPETPVPEPPKPEPPKPEPPKPEPPKPKPEPKPEPPKPKEEPKPKPEPPKPKEEPKPKPKEEPKPKPEPPKPKEEPKPKQEQPKPAKETPKKEAQPQAPIKTAETKKDAQPGVQGEQLPPELATWGRLIQRKVEAVWQVPHGVSLDAEEALVTFWVDRQGALMGEPEVLKAGQDPALIESGIRAIKLAAPFPPLPESFQGYEQQVVYAFNVAP